MWRFARQILLHDRFKFAVATAGVSISVLLVIVQIGLYLGFMGNASALIDHADADVWVAAEATDAFDFASPIDERVVYRVAEVPGVAKTEKVILAFGQIRGAEGNAEGVEVIGIEPSATMLRPWNVVEGSVLARPDGIVVDETEYAKLQIDALDQRREISGSRARVDGLTHGIRSFTTSPYVWTNLAAARSFTRLDETQLTYVLVKAEPGVDARELAARIGKIPHVEAYTKAELSARTQGYWSSRTGVGAGFFTTAVIGVIVGVVVVGQILYSSTLEHIKEYGTLKAMGAANGEVVRVIVYQALMTAAAGFAVGGTLALVARAVMNEANLSVAITPSLLAATAALTVMMCSGSSLLSITKVLRLDPASVFKA
ncbi:MAG: FtsX-like permease family protein [Labilithrix sp.]|nr:FtsX-like permease family protein [Labilithrix sp.]MCW5812493.1 FtsX-like permease family protein [Labilithrix sp.]